jgi:hypothetical protein
MIRIFFFICTILGILSFSTLYAKDSDSGTIKVVVREGLVPIEFRKIKNKLHIFQKKKKLQVISFQGNGGELPLSLSVRVDIDFDEDGYLDLLLTEESGIGLNVNSVFLFSPTKKKFIKLPELNYLPNLSFNTERKEFEESNANGEGFVFFLRRYALVEGKPSLTKEIKQDSMESENYMLRIVREKEDGNFQLKCEALMKKEPEFDLAYLITGDCDTCELRYSGIKACDKPIAKKSTKKPKKRVKKKK